MIVSSGDKIVCIMMAVNFSRNMERRLRKRLFPDNMV
jgi:hypothetical protein